MSLSRLARSIAESPTLRLNEEARILRERGEDVINLLRARLSEEFVRRAAGETAYRTATRIEEALNEGKPLSDAAAAVGVPVVAIDAVEADARSLAAGASTSSQYEVTSMVRNSSLVLTSC